jgi:para-aminobenzoate synthetase/4-amino-4-deoxychorismate lyase
MDGRSSPRARECGAVPTLTPTTVARAVRVALPGELSAADAVGLCGDDAHPFALVGRWAGATALVGGAPLRVADLDEDPFALLDEVPTVDGAPDGFVGGGWVGVLGYALGRRVEPGSSPPPPVLDGERRPAAALAFYDHVLRRDIDGRWWFEALWTQQRATVLRERQAALTARLARPPAAAPLRCGPWHAEPSPTGHARAVAACRERIAGGDLFQANLALRLRASLDGAPAELLRRGVRALQPDRGAYVAGPWGAVASLSPELLVTRHGDRVRSAPIKGTRPRPADPDAAEANRVALQGASKDRAENVMIVDLVRNDLGRVCRPGSVVVATLAEVRAHAGVWHLVSEVTGRLRAGVGDRELVAAMFPPGSVTGAPKVAAMDVVAELESAGRQAFCGAIGFASPAAGLELSVAIRTFECADGHAWLDVGGGVVADSDPDAEAAECLAKAAPLLTAVGGRLAEPPATAAAPVPRRLGPRPVPRPDPAAGIFETVLIRDGIAHRVHAHLARLARSATLLYGVAPPRELSALIDHTALEQQACRLRIALGPAGDVTLHAGPLPALDAAIVLAPVTVPGGLGAHKWQDRRLLDALEAAVAPARPLLVDLDGHVLETSRSCVFAELDGRLVTPPLDGRILPGVARAVLLADHPDAVERPLTLAELAGADRVLLTNALRGVELVQRVELAPTGGTDGP